MDNSNKVLYMQTQTTVYIDKRPTYTRPMWTWVVMGASDGYEYDAFAYKADALAWCARSNMKVLVK